MSRVRVRRFSVILVIVAFVALPAANARQVAPTSVTAGGAPTWLAALTSWVSDLFVHASADNPARRATSAKTMSGGTGGTAHTNTGACIDPNGRPIPCSQS